MTERQHAKQYWFSGTADCRGTQTGIGKTFDKGGTYRQKAQEIRQHAGGRAAGISQHQASIAYRESARCGLLPWERGNDNCRGTVQHGPPRRGFTRNQKGKNDMCVEQNRNNDLLAATAAEFSEDWSSPNPRPWQTKRNFGGGSPHSRAGSKHHMLCTAARKQCRNLTAAEALLKEMLLHKALGPKFHFKHVLWSERQGWGYICDAYCRPRRLIIEAAENSLIDFPENEAAARRKTRVLRDSGFRVFWIPADDIITSPEAIAQKLTILLQHYAIEDRTTPLPAGVGEWDPVLRLKLEAAASPAAAPPPTLPECEGWEV